MKAATYKKKIIRDMKAVETYRSEFKTTIESLAKIYENLDTARAQFEESGSEFLIEHINKNGQTNYIKNPLYAIIEQMNDQILAYSRELGLTPRGLKQLKNKGLDGNKKSKFAESLSKL